MTDSKRFKKRVLELFEQEDAQPLTRSEIARTLEVAPKDRSELRQAVRSLENQGKLQRFKKARYGLPRPGQQKQAELEGKIFFPDRQRGRNAWFQPDVTEGKAKGILAQLGEQDRIFVPAKFSGTALDGDRVAVNLHKSQPPKWHKHVKRHRQKMTRPGEQRWEARVQSVLERKRLQFVGKLKRHRQFAHVEADDPSFGKDIEVDSNSIPLAAEDGSKVVFRLEQWESPFKKPKGRITEVLGREGDPGVDILAIIHRFDLRVEFPETALEEVKGIGQTVDEADLKNREDWREEEVYTIDPFDAKDFDDAICVKRLEEGGWELAVHIADVSHYVRPGTALDKEARRRGNSVYLVDRVLPMLPPELSNGICSLNPDVERLTHSVIMKFDEKGRRTDARFAKTVIRSQRRYSYEEAFERLQKPRPEQVTDKESQFASALHEAWGLASLLRKRRFKQGSLELDFPEVKVILDDSGTPVELRLVEYDISHQLIEEFMLAANEAVAEFTKNRGAGSIYRIHEDPDEDKLFEFRELARSYQYNVGDLTLRTEIQKLLRAIRGKPEEHALKVGFLKSLKRAAYSEQALGHYGLAKVNYTHFTSPIRRYADLVVHRVLDRLATAPDEAGRKLKIEELAEVAEHLCDTERSAADAENESNLLKKFEYLLNIARSGERKTFDAVVTEVLPRGVFVELTDYYMRGMIRRDDMPRGEFYVEPRYQRVSNSSGKVVLIPGNRLKVLVKRVDIEKKFLDFVPAEAVG